MGKKRSRASQTSKGIHGGPMKSRSKLDADYAVRRIQNQLAAWKKGRNVVLTIENPNKNETNRKHIKVNARELWGDTRRQGRI